MSWDTFCLVCGVPVNSGQQWDSSGLLLPDLRKCRALMADGSFTPPVTCGIGGDYFGTPILDAVDGWDAMDVDKTVTSDSRYTAQFNNHGNPEVDEAFPFHSKCAALLSSELSKKSLTTDDLFSFLRGREIVTFIPPLLCEFATSALPSRWRGLRNFWSSLPDPAHIWTFHTTGRLTIPDSLRWVVTPFDNLRWADAHPNTAGVSSVLRNVKTYASYPTSPTRATRSPGDPIEPLPTTAAVVLDLVVSQLPHGYLTDTEVLAVFGASRSLHDRGGRYWRRRCLAHGFAHRPGDDTGLGNAELDWKRAYFCAESRSRRRVDAIVRWIVDRVADAAAAASGGGGGGGGGPPLARRPRELLEVEHLRRHPYTFLTPGAEPFSLWYVVLDFSLLLLLDGLDGKASSPTQQPAASTTTAALDLAAGLSDAQLRDVKSWIASAVRDLDGKSEVEAEEWWRAAVAEPNPPPLPPTDRTNWKWFILRRGGMELGLASDVLERFMDKLGVVY